MGIQGLLPLLKSIQRPTELKKYSGEIFGVDAYVWLHRGAVSCAIELAQGKPTRKYVDFAMNRVRMAKHFGITPYLVFDGGYLPSKATTEASRRKRREECRKTGLELLKAGKPSQAHAELQKAIDITPEMARHLIEELKKANVPYVVAPYEADPQLVYLERHGHISGIISEDSDLLVFGAKRLLTKLDQYGKCVEINRRDFCACREVSLTGWTDTQFRQMAILSGCDYLDSINNMGLKTAHRMMRKHKTPERVIRMLQFDGKYRVPADYLASFHQAEQTFLYQWVFCPKAKELVNFTAPGPDVKVDELPFIGSFIEPEVARGVAIGNLNPITKEIVICTPPSPRKRTASVAANVAPQPRTIHETQASKKPIDSYFQGHRRIPLGEMEPNCFVVDPTRLSNLTENGDRPIVYPLPRPYLAESGPASTDSRPYINRPRSSPRTLRRRAEPVAHVLSNDGRSLVSEPRRQTMRLETNTPDDVDDGETASLARPPKKARLCDDASSGLSPSKRRSKFFSPGSAKSKPSRKGEGYLKSDDSIEEVLKDLPDFDGWGSTTKGQKEIAVYQETNPANADSSKDDENSAASESPAPGNDNVPPNTPSITNRSAYTSSTTRSSNQSYASSSRSTRSRITPASSITSSTPFSSYTQPSTAKTTPATPRMTPLQRLGIQALGRSKQPSTPEFAVPRPPKRSSMGRRALESIAVNPAFVPLPPVDLAEVEALHEDVGSEDLMVPDSESDEATEGQGDLGSSKAGTEGKKMDLSRFLFA